MRSASVPEGAASDHRLGLKLSGVGTGHMVSDFELLFL